MKLNRTMRRLSLLLMSALPFPAVALAAESRLTEMEGEDASNLLVQDPNLLNADFLAKRVEIFAPMTVLTSWDSAYERFTQLHPEIAEPEVLDQTFYETVDKLVASGLVTVNENEVMSLIPSIN